MEGWYLVSQSQDSTLKAITEPGRSQSHYAGVFTPTYLSGDTDWVIVLWRVDII